MQRLIVLAVAIAVLMLLASGAALAQEESLPDLTVEKTGPSTATPDDFVTYYITVTNVGSGDAVLPPGAVLVRDELRTSGSLRRSPISAGSCGPALTVGPVSPTRLLFECWNSESTDFIIPPGVEPPLQGFVALNPPASGGHIINCATVDPDNVIVESDESNNTDCVTTKIVP